MNKIIKTERLLLRPPTTDDAADMFEWTSDPMVKLDGKTVGYLFCRTYTQEKERCTIPHGSRCLEIEELYVLPEYRSCGLGEALYQSAADSYGPEVEYITLSTATKNYKAILHFYIDKLDMTFWSARLFQKRGQAND